MSGPEITAADVDMVRRFHAIQIDRIMRGDPTLGEHKPGEGLLEQMVAAHRLTAEAPLRQRIAELEAEVVRLREALTIIQRNAMNTGFGDVDFRYTTERRARRLLRGQAQHFDTASPIHSAVSEAAAGKREIEP